MDPFVSDISRNKVFSTAELMDNLEPSSSYNIRIPNWTGERTIFSRILEHQFICAKGGIQSKIFFFLKFPNLGLTPSTHFQNSLETYLCLTELRII